ncbi:hypothetical protein [Actinacidiphila acididurans]|uniref:Uncharacterized protein n=1 Tax=Actinacidiphila acididurans TaxID=2784346 RepID=A0ABS2U610_9ACTN|nr:hypothetical protein [Actinacidiphila acididurans]MBM9509930.1 hypothetical protein [Actinacidiphila acididurans]
MPDTTDTIPQVDETLDHQKKEARRKQARTAIETALRDTWDEWGPRDASGPNFPLAALNAVDGLGDLAAEILVDGTMLRSLTIRDGVATMDLEPATEMIKIMVAGMRGILDGYDAKNYVEMELKARPSVSFDLRGSDAPWDSYAVTIQRRNGITPHGARMKAEAERDSVLRVVGQWAYDHANTSSVDVCALLQLLTEAGHTVPGAPADATEEA